MIGGCYMLLRECIALSVVSLQLVYSVCSLQAQSTQAEKCLDV